ncbi:MAG: hypothetical protein ACI35P_04790 [Bacillus sp. (in: firmicutes)]
MTQLIVSIAMIARDLQMGKRNKSKRFFQQSKDSVSKHAEKFPYRMTLAEAESQGQTTNSLGYS